MLRKIAKLFYRLCDNRKRYKTEKLIRPKICPFCYKQAHCRGTISRSYSIGIYDDYSYEEPCDHSFHDDYPLARWIVKLKINMGL